ncbi:BTB And C-terminal Kelch [Sparganum proliferum]
MAVLDVVTFEDEFPLARSCPDLEDILKKDEIPGVEIELPDNEKMTAHEIILAARVPHIRRLIAQHKEDRSPIFQWKTVPKLVAETMLTYVYSGKLEISESTANGLHILAKVLQMSNVERWSMDFLRSRINHENLDARLQFADRIGSQPLKDACIYFMKSAYEEVVSNPTFRLLPGEILLRLLRDDDLKVSSEEAVLNSLLWWVKPACEVDTVRMTQLPALMAEVRWLETSLTFREELSSRDIISEDLSSMQFLHKVCMWIEHPENKDCPFNSKPRKTSVVLYGVSDKDDGRWVCQFYEPQTGQGCLVDHCETRFHTALVCVGGRLLFIGGSILEDSRENATSGVDELNPRTGEWRTLAAMTTRRTYGHTASAVRVGDRQDEEVVVVCGGRDEQENALSSCELYSPPEDCWHKLPDMQMKRSWTAAAALPDGRLFLFGGVGGDNTVEFCCLRDWQAAQASTATTFWRQAAPMNWCYEERYGLAATAFRQDIIVAGGAPESGQAVQIFRPPAYDAAGEGELGQWTKLLLQKLNKERVVFSLLVHGGRLFAFGSCFTDPAVQNTVEEFVPPEDVNAGAGAIGFKSWKWVERPSPANISKIWTATVP